VEALTLENSRIDTIADNASDARYVSGHLLFARVGTLMAVSFDPVRLKVDFDQPEHQAAERIQVLTSQGHE
jgi:hypothetical protein